MKIPFETRYALCKMFEDKIDFSGHKCKEN